MQPPRTRNAPPHKRIPGTPFLVDSFQYDPVTYWLQSPVSAAKDLSKVGGGFYFLSHFHADHFVGLKRTFSSGFIFCSPETANLVKLRFGKTVADRVVSLPMRKEVAICGCKIVLLDANHCPGAVLILFRIPECGANVDLIENEEWFIDWQSKNRRKWTQSTLNYGGSFSTTAGGVQAVMGNEHFFGGRENLDDAECEIGEYGCGDSLQAGVIDVAGNMFGGSLQTVEQGQQQQSENQTGGRISWGRVGSSSLGTTPHANIDAWDDLERDEIDKDVRIVQCQFTSEVGDCDAQSNDAECVQVVHVVPVKSSSRILDESRIVPDPVQEPTIEPAGDAVVDDTVSFWTAGVDRQDNATIPLVGNTVQRNTAAGTKSDDSSGGRFDESAERVYLHTGDFRFCEEMKSYPELPPSLSIDRLYLDDTYMDPSHLFPSQTVSIQAVVDVVRSMEADVAAGRRGRTLYLVGTYHIGKEKVLLGLMEQLGLSVFVTREKYDSLKCCGLANVSFSTAAGGRATFTTAPAEAHVHCVPMFHLGEEQMRRAHSGNHKYEHVVGFRPTGWAFGGALPGRTKKGRSTQPTPGRPLPASLARGPSNGAPVKMSKRSFDNGRYTVFGVPYSEHSSFAELVDCIRWWKPKVIVPTVNVSVAKAALTIETLTSDDPLGVRMQERSTLHRFLTPLSNVFAGTTADLANGATVLQDADADAVSVSDVIDISKSDVEVGQASFVVRSTSNVISMASGSAKFTLTSPAHAKSNFRKRPVATQRVTVPSRDRQPRVDALLRSPLMRSSSDVNRQSESAARFKRTKSDVLPQQTVVSSYFKPRRQTKDPSRSRDLIELD